MLRLYKFGNSAKKIGVDGLRRLRHIHVMQQTMDDRQHGALERKVGTWSLDQVNIAFEVTCMIGDPFSSTSTRKPSMLKE